MRRNLPNFRTIRPEDSALSSNDLPVMAAHREQHDDRGDGFADKDRLTDHVDAAKGLAQGIDGEQKTERIDDGCDRSTDHWPRQAEHRRQRYDCQQLPQRGGHLKKKAKSRRTKSWPKPLRRVARRPRSPTMLTAPDFSQTSALRRAAENTRAKTMKSAACTAPSRGSRTYVTISDQSAAAMLRTCSGNAVSASAHDPGCPDRRHVGHQDPGNGFLLNLADLRQRRAALGHLRGDAALQIQERRVLALNLSLRRRNRRQRGVDLLQNRIRGLGFLRGRACAAPSFLQIAKLGQRRFQLGGLRGEPAQPAASSPTRAAANLAAGSAAYRD